MKASLVISLFFAYTLAISGVTVHAHYCGKKLIAVNFGIKGDPCNKDCSKKPMKCCKDKVVILKVNNDQKTVTAYQFNSVTADVYIPVFTVVRFSKTITADRTVIHAPNAPPGLWQQIPLYKLHSSMVYYG